MQINTKDTNMKRIMGLLFFLAFTFSINAQLFGPENNIVKLEIYQSFDKVQPGGQLKLAVKANIEDGWHINSNKPKEDFLIPTTMELDSSSGLKITGLTFPQAKEIKFDFSDVPLVVYEKEALIGGIISVPKSVALGKKEIRLKFTYQACNNATCLPPTTIDTTFAIEIVDSKTPISEINSDIFAKLNLSYTESVTTDDSESSIANTLESSGILLGLLFVFLGGLALNLTPCVYPLIPITIGYFGGQSEGRTGRLFILGLLYVLGMAITYSIVGVVTSLSGAVFGTLLQNPIVIIFIVLVFIVLALSQFGVYEFKLPDKLVMKAGGARGGMFGAFFMGLTMGIVAAPCIGPFVIGLVTYVAAKGDPVFGFWMFFFLALGLGTPYLFLALFSGKIKSLPRAGLWMESVKHIFGLLLLGMALYFAGPLIPKDINQYVLPVFMIGSGIFLLFFDKHGNNIKSFRIIKSLISIGIIALAVYLLWPTEKLSPEWTKFDEIKYSQSLDNHEKMIIDFYADWCIPCKELDAITFSDPRVIEKTKSFKTYKVDMTHTMDENTEKIRKRFNIKGMPTIIIMDSNGKEIKRLTGFVEPEEFIKIIENVN